MKKIPTVVLIGRTNVGKSTLFNRLIEERKALTSPEPGTTRDRNFGTVLWHGKEFTLIDTGGLDLGYLPKTKIPKKLKLTDRVDPNDLIETNIVKQAEFGIKQADFIIMVVDGRAGTQPEDKTVTSILRKSGKPFALAVNKIDKAKYRNEVWGFSRLGLGDPIPVSALNGSGTGDLLEIVIKKLKFSAGRKKQKEETKEKIQLAIIGRPNVGKSSILNSILGEERVIVSPIAHTTRESQNAEFKYSNHDFVLVDTAGIRRHSKVEKGLEKAGVSNSLLSLRRSDVAILVVEAQKNLSSQDARLAQEILESRCNLIIVGNKWDLVEDKDVQTPIKFTKYFREYFPYLDFAPIIFISAKTGQRVKKVLDIAITASESRKKEIPEKELYKLLKKAVKKHLPAKAKGVAHPYIYSLKQVHSDPPTFELLIHPKAEIHYSYLRFLENQIRDNWDFTGVPIRVNQRFYKK